MEREPGAKSEYSNLGVALLGRLLAQRAGMDYEALLKQRVLTPLHLQSTAITLTREQSRRLAPGHDRYTQPVDTWEMRTLPASGSLRSTANDMLTFLAGYLGYEDTPLKAAIEYQRTVRDPAKPAQALGWGTGKAGGHEIFGHAGGKEGYRSGVYFDPQARTGVVVLANSRSGDDPATIAVHLLTGRPLKPAPSAPEKPSAITLNRLVLDSYAGRYQLASTHVLAVARKDDHLLVDVIGDGIATFFAAGTKEFYRNTGDDRITFEVDADGRTTSLLLNDKPAKRIDTRGP